MKSNLEIFKRKEKRSLKLVYSNSINSRKRIQKFIVLFRITNDPTRRKTILSFTKHEPLIKHWNLVYTFYPISRNETDRYIFAV